MADTSEWIEHVVGPCPAESDTTVIVKFRDGHASGGSQAGFWRWSHNGMNDDIVAYRVVQP